MFFSFSNHFHISTAQWIKDYMVLPGGWGTDLRYLLYRVRFTVKKDHIRIHFFCKCFEGDESLTTVGQKKN